MLAELWLGWKYTLQNSKVVQIFIDEVIDFCFIDRARKFLKHKNSSMEFTTSIIFFATLREGPIAHLVVQTVLKSVGK